MAYLNNKALIEISRKYNNHLFADLSDTQVYNYVVKNMDPEELSGVKGAEFAPWVDDKVREADPYEYKPYIPRMVDNTTQETESPKSWLKMASDMSLPGFIGDVTDWNNHFWEINSITEPQLIAGHQGYRHSIVAKAHRSRLSNLQIEERPR